MQVINSVGPALLPGFIDLIAQRKTKEQNQHDGHPKQHQHGLGVAENVVEFLDDEGEELSHG